MSSSVQMALPGTDIPPVVFDAESAKHEGMQQADEHANPDWKEFALECVRQAAERLPSITSDDVEEQMLLTENRPVTHEKRALGVVMQRAAKAGMISPTNTTRKSNRAKLHGSPRQIWTSLVFVPPQNQDSNVATFA